MLPGPVNPQPASPAAEAFMARKREEWAASGYDPDARRLFPEQPLPLRRW